MVDAVAGTTRIRYAPRERAVKLVAALRARRAVDLTVDEIPQLWIILWTTCDETSVGCVRERGEQP